MWMTCKLAFRHLRCDTEPPTNSLQVRVKPCRGPHRHTIECADKYSVIARNVIDAVHQTLLTLVEKCVSYSPNHITLSSVAHVTFDDKLTDRAHSCGIRAHHSQKKLIRLGCGDRQFATEVYKVDVVHNVQSLFRECLFHE